MAGEQEVWWEVVAVGEGQGKVDWDLKQRGLVLLVTAQDWEQKGAPAALPEEVMQDVLVEVMDGGVSLCLG